MNRLITNIADAMHKIVIDDLSKSPLKNSPLESMAILESLNYSSETYKTFLFENKIKYKISDAQIDEMIKECYTIVYNQFFEKNDRDYDDDF